MNKIQKNAYEIIQQDASFIYNLITIKNVSSNYILMSMPYIGLFTVGAEQWCNKVGLDMPIFNTNEKQFYNDLRNKSKLFDLKCSDYEILLNNKLNESDIYFYNKRSMIEKIIGYYNVGTDICNNEFCGNTIICSMYIPLDNILENTKYHEYLKSMTIISGKILNSLECLNRPLIELNKNYSITYKDYHFYNQSPLKLNNDLGILLFSVLCIINFAIEFIEHFFKEEIPQKFKYAYLQYYYLCDFVEEINIKHNTSIQINKKMYNRNFRNCIAHYGLGQYMNEDDIIPDDMMKGLTFKAFNMNYSDSKKELYMYLKNLRSQIKEIIF